MKDAREQIFASIREALQTLPERKPHPGPPSGAADPRWLAEETDAAALFLKRAAAAGTKVFTDAEACADWLRGLSARVVLLAENVTELTVDALSFAEVVSVFDRNDPDRIDASVTRAAAAIAETGTVVLTDETTPDRLAALAPWTHVVVVRRGEIHRSVADALAALPDDPNVIWVTGPSKTADVEGILIQGVHGPGEQAVLLI